jgi:hypothetical protein
VREFCRWFVREIIDVVYGGSPYALHLDLRVFFLELFLDGLLHVKLLLAYLLLIDQSIVGVWSY